jgi:(2R)-ethylmalonyl-CoA mutase
VVEKKVAALKVGALEELAKIDAMGGSAIAVASGYMKERLVDSNSARVKGVESGAMTVVGVNKFTSTEPSPLSAGEGSIQVVDRSVEAEQIGRLKAWRKAREAKVVKSAMSDLESAAREDRNIMPASIACAKAGVTTGEWGTLLRQVYGEYRPPTGVTIVVRTGEEQDIETVKAEVARVSKALGRALTFVVGKPGLDGHSNGAEQIAVRAGAVGMNVIYEGIRLTPQEIVDAAIEAKAHAVGLSILSGSHLDLVQDVVRLMRNAGMDNTPVIVGGIIPPEDELVLKQMGVSAVYTPKDFKLTDIMADVVKIVEQKALAPA